MGIKCYILQTWHHAPFLIDKRHLVVSDYTPIVYSRGSGTFTAMGYSASITDTYVTLIGDNSFTVTENGHPMEDDYLLCDKVKEVITNVIAKTIAIAQMELKTHGRNEEFEFFIENLPQDAEMPPQMMDIHRWELKKLMVDYNAQYNPEDYKAEMYFNINNSISPITAILTKWDTVSSLSSEVIKNLTKDIGSLALDPDCRALVEEMMNDVQMFESTVHDFYNAIWEVFDQATLSEEGE